MDEIIFKKLAMAKYARKAIIACPDDVEAFAGLDYDDRLGTGRYDMVLHFVFTLDAFVDRLNDIIAHDRLNPGGVVFFAYPKKGNKRYAQYIGRDDFFTVIDMDNDGYVRQSVVKFNKMVAFDDTFTIIGLKHDDRRRRNTQPSQCVGTYVDRIPEIQARLAATPDVLSLFDALTPGYQRGWARYVYAVRTEATMARHLEEMVTILRAGYKSIDLYRQAKK
jgi:hypothetical protein